MLTSQRKKIILEKLAEDGQVLAKQLSEMFGLSEDTVRRDLRELDAEGLLQRVHGGALPVSSAIASFAERNQLESGAKRAIAKAAAALIAPASSDYRRWHHLCRTGPAAAAQPERHYRHPQPQRRRGPGRSPHGGGDLIGGRLYKHSIVSVGAAAVEAMSHIRADIYFMGVTGVHPPRG